MGRWGRGWHLPDPKSAPRSLVHIVGCSSRGRGNCGKLRATSNRASKPVIRSFPSAVRTVEKQLRALASSPLELLVFSTVCIVRQFPWPAFDWRHLPIYRMNQISSKYTAAAPVILRVIPHQSSRLRKMIGFRLPWNSPRVPTSICGEAGQRSADPTRKKPSIHSVREMSQRQTEPYGMTFCMGWHLATRQAR